MELCTGGELFEVLMKRKKFPEAEAARVVRSVISVVHAMHTRGMIHRDLKPENIVLANEDSRTSVRVVDFGLAIGYTAGAYFHLFHYFSDTLTSTHHMCDIGYTCFQSPRSQSFFLTLLLLC